MRAQHNGAWHCDPLRTAHGVLQCRCTNGLQQCARTVIEAARRIASRTLERHACCKTSTAMKLDATTAAASTRRCMPQAAEPPFARLLSSARRRRVRRRAGVRYRTSMHYAQWLHALCAAALPEAIDLPSRPLRRMRRRHQQTRHLRCGSQRRLQRRFIYAQRLTVTVSRSRPSDRREKVEVRRMKPAKPLSGSSTRAATCARRRCPVRAPRAVFSAPRPRRR